MILLLLWVHRRGKRVAMELSDNYDGRSKSIRNFDMTCSVGMVSGRLTGVFCVVHNRPQGGLGLNFIV